MVRETRRARGASPKRYWAYWAYREGEQRSDRRWIARQAERKSAVGGLVRAADRIVTAAPVFAALGDPTRLGIVARLCTQGPQSITSLTEGSRVTRQAITKHLLMLEEAGLVRGEREGRERIWELSSKRLAEARHYLDQISQQWDAAIDRLRAFVEDE
jgi:DNA-binding transcriptional ArsR family regulator